VGAAGGAYYPCSAQWHRSLLRNFSPDGTNLLGAAQTISSFTNFASVVDSTALASTIYFYQCVVVDSQGSPVTVTTPEVGSRLWDGDPILPFFIGDSTTGQVSSLNVQVYNLSFGGAAAGTFTLTFGSGGTSTTTSLYWNATSDQIVKALALLTNIASLSNVSVTGSAGVFSISLLPVRLRAFRAGILWH
jgi:hypothetical protein